MKSLDQALTEWVTNEIHFDGGKELKKFTREQFENLLKAAKSNDYFDLHLNFGKNLRPSDIVDQGAFSNIKDVCNGINDFSILSSRVFVRFDSIWEAVDVVSVIFRMKMGYFVTPEFMTVWHEEIEKARELGISIPEVSDEDLKRTPGARQ